MSKLQELIQKLCPDGVEWKKYYDVCDLIRGITYNKSQEAKTETEDAYKVLRANNITLYLNALNFDDVKLVSKDVVVKPEQHLYAGDILMCAGSGSKEHVGKVAYIFQNMDYTFGGFMAVVRCKKAVLPRYMFHILASHYFTSHLETQINSSTINNINRQVMQSFEIPVPPIEVQEEIVRILDNFTNLAAELQAELQARQEQYEYYRNKLLTFNNVDRGGYASVTWMKMSEIGTFIRGNGLQKKDFTESGVPCIHYGQIYTHYGTFAFHTKSFVNEETAKKCKKAHTGDLVFATVSENVDDVCKCVAWLGDEEICISGDSLAFCHNQNPKYLAYYFQTAVFADYKRSKVTGTKVIRLHQSKLEQFIIPVPSLIEQEHIVSILDKFETLVKDFTEGLPAEMAAVQEQYEYYRNKLLSFPRTKISA